MARHLTKIKIKCCAPEHLTKYNEQLNQEINDHCKAKCKFQPDLNCFKDEYAYMVPCKYAKVTVYK